MTIPPKPALSLSPSLRNVLRLMRQGWVLKRGWGGKEAPPKYWLEAMIAGKPAAQKTEAWIVAALLAYELIERIEGGYRVTEKGREIEL